MKKADFMRKYSIRIRIIGSTIIALVLLLLILIGIEVIFRVQPKYGRSLFQYDDHLIWRLKKNFSGMKSWGEDHFLLSFNKQGFRGDDFVKQKQKGVTRIMVIGDSYTAGLDVRFKVSLCYFA